MANTKIETAAIYFPGFHRDMHYDSWFGEGWNEWELVEKSPDRFAGHRQLRSAWGPFDEADPKWMEKQIDLAVGHGVGVFIFDWYWYSGVKILHRPVEEGFRKARNRKKMKYALMWANHDWCNWFPAPPKGEPHMLLPERHSPEDFERVMEDCIRLHFCQPNYWRVKDRPYFAIYDPMLLIGQLGGPEKTREVLNAARRQVKKAGIEKPHFGAFLGLANKIAVVKEAGFDSLTSYHVSFSGKTKVAQEPFDEYDDLIAGHERHWESMDSGQLPYWPVVTVGWDPTRRWVEDSPFPPTKKDCPNYATIVLNNTPEKFGLLCRKAFAHARASKSRPPAIFVNAWNEWTEGSALLPEQGYGTAFLEELAKAFDR